MAANLVLEHSRSAQECRRRAVVVEETVNILASPRRRFVYLDLALLSYCGRNVQKETIR